MIAVELSGDFLSATAAFLSGVGTVLTGALALRYERKRSKEECDQRFEAFREGMTIGDKLKEGGNDERPDES